MKKFFSLILVAMLSLSPIYAFATEDAQALTPTTSETPAETTSEAPAPEISAEVPASEVTTQDSEAGGAISTEAPSSEQLNTETTTDDTSDETTKTDEESSESETVEDKETDESSEEADEETESDEASEEELEEDIEKEELEEEKEKAPIPEHEHEFEYISNKDGTHTIKCIAPVIKEKEDGEDGETEEVPCDYELIEECTYDGDGVCVYCEYIKPKEKEDFNPIISISIHNSSCVINESNPVIAMYLSQKDFYFEFAQICFANYSQNKFINVTLAHGHYFNHKTGEYVYTDDDGWYASPNIDDYYAQGTYSVRSVYVRSTTGEAVHYSVESGNLPEGYQNYSIELTNQTPLGFLKDIISPSSNNQDDIEESVIEAPVIEEPEVEEPVIEEPVVEEPEVEEPEVEAPKAEEPKVETPKAEEPKVETPKAEEPKVETPKTEEPKVETPKTEEPKVETPKTEEPKTEDPKTEETKTEETKNDSSKNNTNNNSNSLLNFFKRLFGF